MSEIIDRVAHIIAGNIGAPYDELPGDEIQKRQWHRDGRVSDINTLTKEDCDDIARDIISMMRAHVLVYRDEGQVVHELRGAPDDLWKMLLDKVLA